MILDSKGTYAIFATAMALLAVVLLAVPAWSQERAGKTSNAKAANAVGKHVLHEGSASLSDELRAHDRQEEVQRQLLKRQGTAKLSRWVADPQRRADRQQSLRRQEVQQEDDALAGKEVVPKEFDDQGLVTRATVSVTACEVNEEAFIIVEDETGRLGLIAAGNGASIEATSDRVELEGENPGEPILITTTDEQDLQGTVTVVESSGITCQGSAPDPGGDTCTSLEPPLEESGTEPFVGSITNGSSGQDVPLRIVYVTSSDSGSLNITLADESGAEVANETIDGKNKGVIKEDLQPGTYDFQVTPEDQGYAVVFEGGEGTGTDPCTTPKDLDAPAAPEDPDEPTDDGTDDPVDDGTGDPTDDGTAETVTEESGTEDAGTEDAGTEETGTEDAGTEEIGTEESGTEDAGTEATEQDDASMEDTGTDDTGTSETGTSADPGVESVAGDQYSEGGDPGVDPDDLAPVDTPPSDVIDEIDTGGQELPSTGGQADRLPESGGASVLVLLLGGALAIVGAVILRIGMRERAPARVRRGERTEG